MSETTRTLAIPHDVADELVGEGAAVRPILRRGDQLSQVLGFIIDGSNTGASLITIVVSAVTVKRLATSLFERIRRGPGRVVRIQIVAGNERWEHRIDVDDPQAETQLSDAVMRAVEATRALQDGQS